MTCNPDQRRDLRTTWAKERPPFLGMSSSRPNDAYENLNILQRTHQIGAWHPSKMPSAADFPRSIRKTRFEDYPTAAYTRTPMAISMISLPKIDQHRSKHSRGLASNAINNCLILDFKIIRISAFRYEVAQPNWLSPPSRPGLHRICGIPIFRRHL